jgi:D-inositol-3-phosphate glycosyltransferase
VLGNTIGLKDNQGMRIAMISFHTCPLATLGGKDTGGMNVYVRDLTRELGRRGVGVDVFTRSQDEHVPHVLHDLGYGNRIVHIPAGPEVPMAKEELVEMLPEFVSGVEAFAESKGERYDILHAHYWLSGLAALQLREIWRIPIIQMFHTLAAMKNRVAREDGQVEPGVRMEAETRLLHEADMVVASTQAEVAQFQWLYQTGTDRVVVIPPGVDTSHFYPISKDEAKEFVGVPDDRQMVLFVGRIERLKGIDVLLAAFRDLMDQSVISERSICLAIIGGDAETSPEKMDAEMARLRKLVAEYELDGIVRFLGKRDQDSLPYYYSASDIVVVPSEYESFGLVALEAMACGTAVIASETGGLAFLIKDGETGFHVPAGDAAILAEKIQMLLCDSELRRQIGRKAAAYASGFDWSIIADHILELYAGLVPRLA